MNNNDLQMIKEFINEIAASGLIIDEEGFNRLKDMILQHEMITKEPMSPSLLIQFVFNEGAKAGAQQILEDYKCYINTKYGKVGIRK